MARMAKIQFRISPELEDRLQKAVNLAIRKGAVGTTMHSYARVLLEVALGVKKNVIVTDEVLAACTAAQARLGREIGRLLVAHMDELLAGAKLGAVADSSDDE